MAFQTLVKYPFLEYLEDINCDVFANAIFNYVKTNLYSILYKVRNIKAPLFEKYGIVVDD